MVTKWNLLEGYQGLTELAESRAKAWKIARNQEIAGGLSNRALVRSWAMANTPPLTPNRSLRVPGPGLYAHPCLHLEQRERTGCLGICGGGRCTPCPPMTTHNGREWVSMEKSRCCYKVGWRPNSPKAPNAHCRRCYLNPGQKADTSP